MIALGKNSVNQETRVTDIKAKQTLLQAEKVYFQWTKYYFASGTQQQLW